MSWEELIQIFTYNNHHINKFTLEKIENKKKSAD